MSAPTTPLRWGVLSTAKIGRTAVIPAIQRSAHGTVVAIASRNGETAEAVAGDLGIPQAFSSYEALLAADDIDAVYIPLPNHLHAEWTMKAAAAGKHVLCEKPLTLDADEAQRVVAHCAAAGVVLQEAFMYRFHPQWLRTKRLVDDGHIGELRAVQAWFSYFNDDATNIRNVAEFGGGALMDIGCYPISVARWLFGAEPDDVQAIAHHDPTSGVDVQTSAMMRFGTAQATFTVSTRSAPYQRVHVVGSAGRIEVEIPFNAPNDRPTRIFVTSGGQPSTAHATEIEEFGTVDQYTLQADAFAMAIREGRTGALPTADSLANMAVIDAVRAAAGSA
jgi:predicted dehydrogenase